MGLEANYAQLSQVWSNNIYTNRIFFFFLSWLGKKKFSRFLTIYADFGGNLNFKYAVMFYSICPQKITITSQLNFNFVSQCYHK